MLTIMLVLSALLAGALVVRPALGGRPFAFAALFVLPVSAALMGAEEHVENSKKTTFCTSCHVMDKHGRSLHVDDSTLLAASHYQGGRIPREQACYTCHTTYTMYGGLASKMRGVKHVLVNYFGTVPKKIKLYEPYNNRECLHCHDGARRYEAAQTHAAEPGRQQKIRDNQLSCISKDCHESVHAADEVDSLPLWKPGGKS